MLASRPVVAFALLRQCSELMRTDLLSGVAILIRPLVNDLSDQIFDSRVLAQRLADAYGVSIPSAALEGMTYRLVAANVLRIEAMESGLTRALYTATADAPTLEPDAEKDFQEIIDDFLAHARDRLLAAGKNLSDDTLITGFLRHLATLDFSAIKARPQVIYETTKKILGPAGREEIALSAQLAEEAVIDSLVASYVGRLREHQPGRLTLLAKVADGALAAELVFDLQAPTSVSRLMSTTVIVDTPLVLSYLDLSSSQDTVDARSLINQIRETGARVAAFRHSIEEAEGVLKAIQNARGGGDAYGPSVHRLSNSTFRAYFDSMIGFIGRSWTKVHELEILPEGAEHSQKNFTAIDEEELVSAIRFSAYDRVLTRERDAKSVAETIRRLGGAHIPIGSVSSCRFIFATSNTSLQRRVAGFLHRKKYVLDGEFNPIITSRYLSGLCWLMCGGRSDQSPTTARLLANCAAALRLKPEIAERTKRFLADIDPEKARHFEVLMTNERASQYLAEATLGDANVVTANNAEEIFEEVQRRAAEKVAVEKDQQYLGQISALRAEVNQGEEGLTGLKSSLLEAQLEIDSRKMEVWDLNERANELEVLNVDGNRRLAEQDERMRQLEILAATASGTANEAQRQLLQQREQGRIVAQKFADRRATQIRWFGVGLLFVITFVLGYVDKFVTPMISVERQRSLNFGLISLQSLFALSGIGLLMDPLTRKPVERLRARLYGNRLKALGIPTSADPAGSQSE